MIGRQETLRRWNLKAKQYKREWYQKKRYGHVIPLIECARCGEPQKTDKRFLLIHHIDGNNGKRGKPLNNNRDNLIVLCFPCHPKVHAHGVIKEVLV